MALSFYTSALLTTFIATGLSTVVVALRFYARYFLVGKLSWADWIMLAALLSTWFTSVSNYFMIHYLKRAESSRIYDKHHAWPKDITAYLMWIWIFRINYIVSLCLIKTSILLFYNFVASSRKSFYRIVRAMIAIVIIVSFAMILASIFSCNPPSDAWSFGVWIRQFRGIFAKQCYNPANLWLFSAGFNLVTDTFIWILPIPFILHLRTMNTRRQLELVGIFSIGLVALVASAMRLRTTIVWLTDYKRQAQNSATLTMWTQAEQHAGIISASIPFLRPIIRRAFNATIRSRDQHSPSPAKRLIPPVAARTPIIPSPSPTLGSRSSLSRPPPSPLAPISPITPEIPIGTAL